MIQFPFISGGKFIVVGNQRESRKENGVLYEDSVLPVVVKEEADERGPWGVSHSGNITVAEEKSC